MLLDPPRNQMRQIRLWNVELPPTANQTTDRSSEKRAELAPLGLPEIKKKDDITTLLPLQEEKKILSAPGMRPTIPEFPTSPLTKPKSGSHIEVLAVDGDKLPDSRLLFDRIYIDKAEASADGSGKRSNRDGDGGDSAGLTGNLPGIPLSMRASMPEDLSKYAITDRLVTAEDADKIEKLMSIKIFRYLGDEGAFFRIDIIPSESAKMPPFQKDLVFCIDISGSISSDRLNEFRNGVSGALRALKPSDGFEIIAFSHKEAPLFGAFKQKSPENIALAEEFLSKLSRSGSTNIFSAIRPFAGRRAPYSVKGNSKRPLLLFLFSDGLVNSGEVVDSRELINSFSNENQDSTSLYSFCSGKKTNSFLLDLLSYRNRGESMRSAESQTDGSGVRDFITEVSEILVGDLDYQISGRVSEATFPKKLPHLYRNRKLSLYGKHDLDIKEIGVRIVGFDSLGRRQEIVFKGNLDEAENAGPELAKDWARQYIFHLYSRLSADYSETLMKMIHDSAAKFGIETSYYDKFLKKRKPFDDR